MYTTCAVMSYRGLGEIFFRLDTKTVERRQRRELRTPARQRGLIGKRHGLLEMVRLEAADA
jgi:hypothetical protein